MLKLPVDIDALLDEVTNLNGKKDAPVSVSMYIDDTAADDCIAYVRNAFASASSNARFSISYLINSDFVVNPEDDFAVIVAGRDSRVGQRAAELRAAGVPVMVATTCPQVVAKIAKDQENEIPEGDIVAPERIGIKDSKAAEVVGNLPVYIHEREDASKKTDGQPDATKPPEVVVDEIEVIEEPQPAAAPASAQTPDKTASDAAPSKAATTAETEATTEGNTTLAEVHGQARPQGVIGSLFNAAATAASRLHSSASSSKTQAVNNPFAVDVPEEEDDTMPLDDDMRSLLSERMGRWVIAACRDKSLALAVAFPFVRKPFAENIVNVTSVQNAGVGVVLFIPGADMPIMTLNQCKMVLQIASAYNLELSTDRALEIVAIVAGGFACRSFARQILGAVPVLGWAVKGAIGYAGTLAMGKAAIEYFESGSGVMGVAGLGAKITAAMQKVVAAATGQDPEAEKKTKAEAAMDFAKKASKVAAGAASNVGPVAQAAGKVAAQSFASGISSMASSVTK